MKILDCDQRSDDWFAARSGIPTASRFDKIITPSKGTYSSQAKGLIASLIAEQLPGYEQPYLSNWVQRGTELEPLALSQYSMETDHDSRQVGFVYPDGRTDVGCSPDGFVVDGEEIRGLVELKCPKAETLVCYHLDGDLPTAYKAQVHGQLWITGLSWCDFYAWHPEVDAFLIRVQRDEKFIQQIAACVDRFCEEYESAKKLLGQ